jgi:hypothetical protein
VLGGPLLDWHRRAFEAAPSFVVPPSRGTTNSTFLGKIVLYADRDLIAPDLSRFVSHHPNWLGATRAPNHSLPYLADIPIPGQPILCGQPICTFFARGRTESECLAKLLRRAVRFQRL